MNYKFNAKYFKNDRRLLIASLITIGVGLLFRYVMPMFDALGVLIRYFERVGLYMALIGAVVAVIDLSSAPKTKDIDEQIADFKKRNFSHEPNEDFIIMNDFLFPESGYSVRRDGERQLRSSEYSYTKITIAKICKFKRIDISLVRNFVETKNAEFKATEIKNAELTEKEIIISPELGKYVTDILTIYLKDGSVAFEAACTNDQANADFLEHFNRFIEKSSQNS